ncbi:hypothetical protein R3P38DRAFT_2771334 [Favolaschia claudopus]|uniref:Uncharacterized protein n=1 Tax=Favolaschia claudopus TaxID=2862362 RepID=A0AAV9Z9W8_9AGAR
MRGPRTPLRGHLLSGYLSFYNSQRWPLAEPESWTWKNTGISAVPQDPYRRRVSLVGPSSTAAVFEVFGMVKGAVNIHGTRQYRSLTKHKSSEGFIELRRPTWKNLASADREFAVHYDKQLVSLAKALEQNNVDPSIKNDCIILTSENTDFKVDTVIFATATLSVYPFKISGREEFYSLDVKSVRTDTEQSEKGEGDEDQDDMAQVDEE